MNQVLIVDDEPDILDLLSITVKRMGLVPHTADTLSKAKELLANQTFQLCLTDMRLPDGSGMDLLQHIQAEYPQIPAAMITAYGSMDVAIEAMKNGAFDFLSKPVDLEKLRSIINNAIKLDTAPPEEDESTIAPNILGQSLVIQKLKKQIAKVSRSHAPVFIHGESGSGKELVARAIHQMGPRSDQPFIAVNCGAIPSELMESEFFGHKKGAFTGANSSKEGFFQAAQRGTLFLDEVADLPLVMQVKLLRAIQENAVRPVGSESEISVDVRILSASHKDLQLEVEEKNFREDLFYRLDVISLEVPSLRKRLEDVPLLSKHLLNKLSSDLDLADIRLGESALTALSNYHFPGNVRELENLLQRAITLVEGSSIEVDDLNLKVAPKAIKQENEEAHYLAPGQSLEEYLEEVEREILSRTLEECRWNKTAAAEQLGMSFRSIRYRLKKLGID